MLVCLSVGDKGAVYSFERETLHMDKAKANYQGWCNSWDIAHPSNLWPRNVHFFEVSVQEAASHVHAPLDAVSVDTQSASSKHEVVLFTQYKGIFSHTLSILMVLVSVMTLSLKLLIPVKFLRSGACCTCIMFH